MKPSTSRVVSKFMPELAVVALFLTILSPSRADEQAEEDAAYIARFQERHKRVENAPTLDAYASPSRYDELFMGQNLAKALENVSNDQGGLAWGLSSRMMSLNEMFRITGDVKYFMANLDCIRKVIAARDDKRGVKLWTGVVAPAWGSDKYAERGRAIFAVHTGLITQPMLDLLLIARQHPDLMTRLGAEYEAILTAAEEAIAYHDRQWRDGPGPGEGHYIGMDQENVCEGKPLPGNRLSAIGCALWVSWKVTGNPVHRDRARALGAYIKNRLTLASDGAYYWPYWLPLEQVTEHGPAESFRAEDSSHAGLTIALPLLLASEGQVFNEEDLKRFANTLIKGFGRLGDGVFLGDIRGNPDSDPRHVGSPADWLPISTHVPQIRDPVVKFYLNYDRNPSPYELTLLLQYANK